VKGRGRLGFDDVALRRGGGGATKARVPQITKLWEGWMNRKSSKSCKFLVMWMALLTFGYGGLGINGTQGCISTLREDVTDHFGWRRREVSEEYRFSEDLRKLSQKKTH
jgi:hypothetical protein